MNQLNSLILVGNIIEPIEVSKEASKGRFTIGTKRIFKNRNGEDVEEISFFEVECFGHFVELVSTFNKGDEIQLVGKLKQEYWKHSGKSFSKVYVVAEHIERLKKANV